MTQLGYYQKAVKLDRKTQKILYKNNDCFLVGVWDLAIRASMELVQVDLKSQVKEGFYFDFNPYEEGAGDSESNSFAELVFKAGFDGDEEKYCAFRSMVEIAIEEGILVDVSGMKDVKTEKGYRSYAFKEVLNSVEKYLEKDTSKSYGGVKRQAPKETQEIMDRVRNLLLKHFPTSRDPINRFCSTYVKEHTDEIASMDEEELETLFLDQPQDYSM